MSNSVERETGDSLQAYLSHLGNFDRIGEEEVLPLVQEIRAGMQGAFERFTEANLRLVVTIAKRYRGQGVEFNDLIQAGNLGLMEAVRRFDPEQHGTQFSTYATPYVRGKILNELSEHSRTIRIPGNRKQLFLRIRYIIRDFETQFSREPTIEEIAIRMDMKPKKVKDLLENNPDTVSLSTPLSDAEDDGTLGDKVEDLEGVSPERIALQNQIAEVVEGVINNLDETERTFLTLRFGLDGNGCRSYREIIEQLQRTDRMERKRFNMGNIKKFEQRILEKVRRLTIEVRHPKVYRQEMGDVA